MKKSLEEILSRQDYKNLTPALKERVEAIAKAIRRKMDELDLTDRIIPGNYIQDGVEHSLGVQVKKVSANGCSDYYLALSSLYFADEDNDGFSLEDVGRSYYYCNNYNALVRGVSYPAALKFLNASASIIRKLGEIETEQVKAVTAALAATENTEDEV